MALKVGDHVRMASMPEINGIITWMSDEIDQEGRCIHLEVDKETYRVNEASMELCKDGES